MGRPLVDQEPILTLQPKSLQVKARCEGPSCYPKRERVPEKWSKEYQATYYVSSKILDSPPWAELVDWEEAMKARALSKGLEFDGTPEMIRHLVPSYEKYQLGEDSIPRNPRGPTGVKGQGILGKHGPNFACDPVVLRKVDGLLKMIAIRRADNGCWAIPGGMADYGESVSQTLGRELREEALGDKASEPQSAKQFDERLAELFETKGFLVYQGVVDDFRNTDTSWMETSVVALELGQAEGEMLGWDLKLTAGDDAAEAAWMPLTHENLEKLHANHGDFVRRAVQLWQLHTGLVVLEDGSI